MRRTTSGEKYRLFALFAAAALVALSGCAALELGENLPRAIADQPDPAVVRDGAPAYLVTVDAMILGDPEDEDLLLAGAKLYSLYAALFAQDEERAKRLSERAFDYASRALCAEEEEACALADRTMDEVGALAKEFDEDELPTLHAYGAAWLLYVKTHAADWNAVAQLPKIEVLLDRVAAIDESYDGGSVHLYLGLLKTALPPALGGRPEEARLHFERALALSGGKNLSVKVAFARNYARLLYDRPLHDRLLNEVLAADPRVEGYTLTNTLAKEEARRLLDSAEDYF